MNHKHAHWCAEDIVPRVLSRAAAVHGGSQANAGLGHVIRSRINYWEDRLTYLGFDQPWSVGSLQNVAQFMASMELAYWKGIHPDAHDPGKIQEIIERPLWIAHTSQIHFQTYYVNHYLTVQQLYNDSGNVVGTYGNLSYAWNFGLGTSGCNRSLEFLLGKYPRSISVRFNSGLTAIEYDFRADRLGLAAMLGDSEDCDFCEVDQKFLTWFDQHVENLEDKEFPIFSPAPEPKSARLI